MSNDDLVQRLRVFAATYGEPLCCIEAADRIEALERTDDYWNELQKFRDLYPTKLGELFAAQRRIETLDTKIGLYAKLLDEHHERITTLEAALREIEPRICTYCASSNIARRALEGK